MRRHKDYQKQTRRIAPPDSSKSSCITGSSPASNTHYQRHQKHYKEKEKENLRDSSRRHRNPAETENRRDNGDQEKDESIMQHFKNPPQVFNRPGPSGSDRKSTR
jgi:hypothetical protein